MTFHDRPATYAEALENLTEENWHTERALIEAEVSRRLAISAEALERIAGKVERVADGVEDEASNLDLIAQDIRTLISRLRGESVPTEYPRPS